MEEARRRFFWRPERDFVFVDTESPPESLGPLWPLCLSTSEDFLSHLTPSLFISAGANRASAALLTGVGSSERIHASSAACLLEPLVLEANHFRSRLISDRKLNSFPVLSF